MREFLPVIPLPALTIAGLFIFLAVFSGVLGWVLFGPNRELYRKMEKLPLNEGGLK